ncbi:unnamed protein product [Didymodactylos carnosus]|uniref:Uncharacterized protein n=1 Tax=Didymodactylos carnosus TaxID=1234261 RepID=A0A814KFS1_9BILA|nr:unnamed protein product [Didymodactylos carnosus]CAF1173780.1 unnamed protein product [Didymodactylos carnosus]CAF3821355.1 unnamed protein product [Didymodactylos carnosus]CAF3985055.1 unnamed protein product [Didymodactylos carnosus]
MPFESLEPDDMDNDKLQDLELIQVIINSNQLTAEPATNQRCETQNYDIIIILEEQHLNRTQQHNISPTKHHFHPQHYPDYNLITDTVSTNNIDQSLLYLQTLANGDSELDWPDDNNDVWHEHEIKQQRQQFSSISDINNMEHSNNEIPKLDNNVQGKQNILLIDDQHLPLFVVQSNPNQRHCAAQLATSSTNANLFQNYADHNNHQHHSPLPQQVLFSTKTQWSRILGDDYIKYDYVLIQLLLLIMLAEGLLRISDYYDRIGIKFVVFVLCTKLPVIRDSTLLVFDKFTKAFRHWDWLWPYMVP